MINDIQIMFAASYFDDKCDLSVLNVIFWKYCIVLFRICGMQDPCQNITTCQVLFSIQFMTEQTFKTIFYVKQK